MINLTFKLFIDLKIKMFDYCNFFLIVNPLISLVVIIEKKEIHFYMIFKHLKIFLHSIAIRISK